MRQKYLMRMQVFPTAPSPTTTSFIDVGSSIIYISITTYSNHQPQATNNQRALARAFPSSSRECPSRKFIFSTHIFTYSLRSEKW